jgi:hypothetical protein
LLGNFAGYSVELKMVTGGSFPTTWWAYINNLFYLYNSIKYTSKVQIIGISQLQVGGAQKAHRWLPLSGGHWETKDTSFNHPWQKIAMAARHANPMSNSVWNASA